LVEHTNPYSINNNEQDSPFNPLGERLKDYDEAWSWLGRISIEYNWNYRKRICTKCPTEVQKKLNCFRVDNYKVTDGVKIQETHCSKLENARENKMRNHVKHVFALDPLSKC